ncbi:glycosyltransferase family 2 protein [Natronoflexus pectinivorans]|uniref:Cellulose synthase/poly-beta-1,6-N-acetylglucosamine synthase-like glycosyltransferase n=1 Tax=Natronoflexus pectinivorans TaxID=682526 RepID=A0A4R2GF79_9BACT|nr:glycosyltransferase family 2 protein [Natronoflexus pectinivorans]TCO06865.1 cellulose synthase/poly-beta-1,6-N-acetylglucosamine synthase-like glycosyltransferase [Natronoflexus pectinivorans]
MTEQPFVSVVLPIRNEEKYIAATLTTVLEQDYPKEKLEIIIADGMSTDNTRQVVEQFISEKSGLKIELVDNPELTVPFGLNRSITSSTGDVIVRMDAHSVYPSNYISRLVKALFALNADNVGGVVDTVPANDKVKSKAIAIALSHPLGVGNSYFRIGSDKIKEVDTVPFGCFRREVFQKNGMFDEDLVRNQDDEFNGRMKNAGMKILLIPDVVVKYFARDSFSKLYKMYFQYGLYKPLAGYKLGGIPTVRQLIPFFFVLFLFGGLLLSLLLKPLFYVYFVGVLTYLTLLVGISIKLSFKHKQPLMFHLVWSFFILHFSYGVGYLRGLTALVLGQKGRFRKSSLSR